MKAVIIGHINQGKKKKKKEKEKSILSSTKKA